MLYLNETSPIRLPKYYYVFMVWIWTRCLAISILFKTLIRVRFTYVHSKKLIRGLHHVQIDPDCSFITLNSRFVYKVQKSRVGHEPLNFLVFVISPQNSIRILDASLECLQILFIGCCLSMIGVS